MFDLNSSSTQQTDSSSNIQALGARFVSINPAQDSLEFSARSSVYDAEKKIIWAKGVDHIDVANASVRTADGNVYIERRAKMQTLDNTKIITDKYEFFNSTVTIEGRHKFFGSGYYNYIDENDSVEVLAISNIDVDSTETTVGKGKISLVQNFKLSPVYNYFGDIKINTNDSFPYYNGSIQLVHDCDKLKINPISRPFIKFKSFLNPDSLYIPIVDINHENASYAATAITIDSTHIYSSFLSPLGFHNDSPIIKADQMLHFNKISQIYSIAPEQKLLSPEEKGNLVSLNKNFCTIYDQGDVDFGMDYGQIKVNATGELFHNIEQDKITLNVCFGLDFFFSQSLIDIMYNAIQQETGLKPVDMNSASVKYDLVQLSSKDALDKMFSELSSSGVIETVPQELNKTIFFSDVKLVWKQKTESFVSEGPIGIGFIKGKAVNKKMTGIIEMTKKKSGNILNIYIEAAPDKWFFFSYSQNVLRTFSKIDAYNAALTALPDKEKKMEVERNQTPFSFVPSSERIKSKFLFRILQGSEDEEE
jgi:hypothetical protein